MEGTNLFSLGENAHCETPHPLKVQCHDALVKAKPPTSLLRFLRALRLFEQCLVALSPANRTTRPPTLRAPQARG